MIRIMPSVLTDGFSQLKGEKFDSWRVVGTVPQAVRLHASRDVDEILLLDVKASQELRLVSLSLVESMATFLRIPLTVGGGIRTTDDVSRLMASGADRVCIGQRSQRSYELFKQVASKFGSQSLVVSVDVWPSKGESCLRLSTGEPTQIALEKHLRLLEHAGVGEVLLQSVDRDGTLSGLDQELIARARHLTKLPIIASSGLNSVADAVAAINSGASAIAGGAIFQFTSTTPKDLRDGIREQGFRVRNFKKRP